MVFGLGAGLALHLPELLELLNQLVGVRTNFILFEIEVQRPKQNSCHFFPPNVSRFAVNQAPFAFIGAHAQHADEARSCLWSNACLGGDEEIVCKFVGVLPAVVALLKVGGDDLASMHPLAHDLRQHLVLHGVVHQANDVAGRSVVVLVRQTMRARESTIFQAQLLALTVHFKQERLDVVLVPLVGVHERHLDSILSALRIIVVDAEFSLVTHKRQGFLSVFVASQVQPPSEFSSKKHGCIVARWKQQAAQAVVD